MDNALNVINSVGEKFTDAVNTFSFYQCPFSIKDLFNQDVELKILRFFNSDISSYDDIRTRSWAIMRLEDCMMLIFAYLLIVLVGYLLRRRDPPPQLKGVNIWGWISRTQTPREGEGLSKRGALFNLVIALLMLAYNATQVGLCAYMCYAAVKGALEMDYKLVCNKFELGDIRMARVLHVFYLSKILDFMDTFFMVIRGRWRQVSFLHLYHHTSIFLVYWVNTNAGYDGDIYYTIVLNSFIHFIMYFYYGLTALGIKVPTVIKMFITNSQLTQFVLMVLQGTASLSLGCPYPKNIVYMYLLYLCTMLYLFTDFHKKTYGDKDKNAENQEKDQEKEKKKEE